MKIIKLPPETPSKFFGLITVFIGAKLLQSRITRMGTNGIIRVIDFQFAIGPEK
jgi:hypothetical protein